MLAPWKESYDQPIQYIKKQTLLCQQRSIKSKLWLFQQSCTDVRAGHKKDWVPKDWCLQIVVLEKTLDSPLDCKEIKPVNPNGNQPWIFVGRTDAEAETPILWPPDVKSWLIRKDPDAGKSYRTQNRCWSWNQRPLRI